MQSLDKTPSFGEGNQWVDGVHLQLSNGKKDGTACSVCRPCRVWGCCQWGDYYESTSWFCNYHSTEISTNYSWILCSLLNGLSPSLSWLFIHRFWRWRLPFLLTGVCTLLVLNKCLMEALYCLMERACLRNKMT